MEATMRKLIRSSLAVITILALTSCGGGGGSSGDPITISRQDPFVTDQYNVVLRGKSFVPADSFCYINQTISFRAFAGEYSVVWENLANSSSGIAHVSPFCEQDVSWEVLQGIPLALGENQVTATLTTDTGTWQDTVIVTRLVDVIPPKILGVFPEGLSTGTYNGFISMTFSEQIDLDSLWNNFSLQNSVTKELVSGDGSLNTVSPSFQPNPGLDANTTYIVHIDGVQDLSGNVMNEPVEWVFTTGF